MIITASSKNKTVSQEIPKRYERRETIVSKGIERLIENVQNSKMEDVKIRVDFELEPCSECSSLV